MKFFRHIALVIAILTGTGLNAQTCWGDFTTGVSGLTANFSGTVTMNVNSIIWSFGDFSYDFSNQINVSHAYAQPGTYTACIIVQDTMNNCSDSTCHTVVVDSCYGTMSYTINGLTVTCTGSSSMPTANTAYMWNFGDNNAAYGQSLTHTYAQAGTYTLCFAYYDQSNNCSDSICTQITVGQQSCQASFTYVDSTGYVFFINTSTPGMSGSYFWDFGDGNYSYMFNPAHTYAQQGTYQVCLVAYDSLQNFCDSTCMLTNAMSSTAAGMQDQLIDAGQVQLAPNPAYGSFSIRYSLLREADVQVSLYDISGRYVNSLGREHLTAGQQQQNFSTNTIAAGTYFLRIEANGQIINRKLIIAQQP